MKMFQVRQYLVASVAVVLLASTSVVTAQSAPGLAERRAIASYEKTNYPTLQKKIQDAAGFEVPIDVDWNSLALPGDSTYYEQDDYFVKTIFEPVEDAMKSIAADDMGKQALHSKLQKITISYSDGGIPASAYNDRVKFEAGNLEINFRPFTNTADVKERTDAIVKLLEANL